MNKNILGSGLCCLLLGLAGCGFFVSVDDHIERASTAKAAGDYGLAAIELRNALQSAPDNLLAQLKLVEVLLLQSDLGAAAREVEALRKLDTATSSLKSDAADIVARVMLAKRDFQGLLTAIKAGELPLADSTLPLREAQALMGLGQTVAARDKLQTFLAQVPDSDEGHIYYAQLLANTGEKANAVREIDAVLARSPTYANAWFAKGMWQTMQGASSDAAQSFAKAAEHAAGQLTRAEETVLVSLLADAELTQGRIDAATKWQLRLAAIAPGAPVTELTTARIAIVKEDYATAIGLLQKVLSKQPDMSQAQVMLAKALAAQGNLRQAEAELDKVVAKESANLEARAALADINVRLGQNVRALELLAPITARTRDNSVAALTTKAQIAVAASPTDLAKLLSAQKREPANEALRLLTAGTLLRARQPSQAISLLRDASNAQVDLGRVPLLLSAVVADKGVPTVRAEAEKIGAAHVSDARYAVTLGLFFAGNQDYLTARTWFERAQASVRSKQDADEKVATDHGDDADASVGDVNAVAQRVGVLGLIKMLGVVDARLGDKTAALAGIQAYRQAHPDDMGAVLIEGDILLELREFPAAVAAYETVFTKAPNSQVAIALYRARRLAGVPEPVQSLEQWLKTHDSDVTVRMFLAEALQSSGDTSRAVTEYERIIALQPLNAAALNNLAVLYQDKGDKRAESTALQAYKRADKSPEVADTYGWILLQNGKADEATQILATALAGAPKHPDIQFHHAMAVAKTGAADAARKQLTELLAQYPKFSTRAEAEKALRELK